MHQGHKVILVKENEYSEQKEINTNIDLFQDKLNKNTEEIIKIKHLIENETDKINNTYDKVYNEIMHYFNDSKKNVEELIDELNNEVTKIKEKFENFLSICNV